MVSVNSLENFTLDVNSVSNLAFLQLDFAATNLKKDMVRLKSSTILIYFLLSAGIYTE